MGKIWNNKNDKTSRVVSILYEDRLPANFREKIVDAGYSTFVSPLHTPDDENKKPHRHIGIRGNSGNDLSFKKVHALLEDINPGHAAPMIVDSLDEYKAYARYTLHLTDASKDKQQFDLREPRELGRDAMFLANPYDGVLPNGLLSIYHEKNGFFECKEDYLTLAVPPSSTYKARNEKKEQQGSIIKELTLEIFEKQYCSFASFVRAHKGSEGIYFSVIARFASYFKSLISDATNDDIREEKKTPSTGLVDEYKNRVGDENAYYDADYALRNVTSDDVYARAGVVTSDEIDDEDLSVPACQHVISKLCDINIYDELVLRWLCIKLGNALSDDYNTYLRTMSVHDEQRAIRIKVHSRRLLLQYYDAYNESPRDKYLEDFTEFVVRFNNIRSDKNDEQKSKACS